MQIQFEHSLSLRMIVCLGSSKMHENCHSINFVSTLINKPACFALAFYYGDVTTLHTKHLLLSNDLFLLAGKIVMHTFMVGQLQDSVL